MILLKWCFPKQVPGFIFEVVLFIFAQVNAAQKGRESFAVTSFPHPLILQCLAPSSGWYTWLGHTGTPRAASPQVQLSVLESITMKWTQLSCPAASGNAEIQAKPPQDRPSRP